MSETSLEKTFWKLAATSEPPDLRQGPRPGVLSRKAIEEGVDRLLDPSVGGSAAPCLMATALLYHDHHDAAHNLVQDMKCSDGALIHAIIHRREPDYWNARYWLRQVGDHPVFKSMAERVKAMADCNPGRLWSRKLTLPGTFDPFAFVDACESLARRPQSDPEVEWMRRVQQVEFECLVRHLLGIA